MWNDRRGVILEMKNQHYNNHRMYVAGVLHGSRLIFFENCYMYDNVFFFFKVLAQPDTDWIPLTSLRGMHI